MCREIEKLVNANGEVRFAEGKAEGKAEGRAEGKAEGRAEGKAEGEVKGEAKGKAESICNLMKNAGMDFDTAAKMIGCSEEDASALKPLVDAMMSAEK